MSESTRRESELAADARPGAVGGEGEGAGGFRDVGMHGLRVRTAIDLPGWPEPPPGEPDVTIVEEAASTPTFEGAPFTSRATYVDGEVRAEVRGVGQFRATATSLRVAPEAGAKPEDIRLYVTGAMFGVVLHQRGVYALHASSVAIDGVGLAFAGPSGSGKSTLVAALLRRGATFVSDDICALALEAPGGPRVWPGASRLKLDLPGMSALDTAPSALEPAGGDRGKYHVPVAAAAGGTSPVPLAHVFLLGFGDGDVRIEPLSGLYAVSALIDETYLLGMAAALGRSEELFRKAADVSRTLTVSRLIRPHGLAHLDAVVDRIESTARGTARDAGLDVAGSARG